MAEEIGVVAALWRFPVKSMLGEAPAALDVDPRGVVADRLFAVRDAEGKFGSGKTTRRFRRIDGLLGFQASLIDGVPWIRFPDSTTLRGDDPAVHSALSIALGQPVTLAREAAVSHFDAGAVHLVTSASLRGLAARLPGSRIDACRFRPNVVIDRGDEGPPEPGWIGRVLRIGDRLRLRVSQPTERCVMVTSRQGALDDDPGILRELAAHDEACFGLYAQVVEPGPMRLGDRIALEA